MPPDRISLSNGAMTAEIGLQGGTILGFAHLGGRHRTDLLRPTPPGHEGDPLQAACFPLVPFGNRVRGNSFVFDGTRRTLRANHTDKHYLHGDGWLAPWTLAQRSDHAAVLTLAHGAAPYRYFAEQHFDLAADGLSVALGVRNDGDAALPFGLGLHPYFPLTATTTLRAHATRFWPEAEDYLPGQEAPLPDALDFAAPRALPRHWVNNGFAGWDGRAEITWPDAALALDIRASSAFGAFVLFVSDPAFQPGYAYEYFCFEPMTHAPDDHNRADLGGLAVLAPGESLRVSIDFRCRPLTTEMEILS